MEELQKLKFILDQSLFVYWDWNIKEDRATVSPSFEKYFGYTPEEVSSVSLLNFLGQIVHPKDYFNSRVLLHKHFESKGNVPYEVEERYYHKNGNLVWVTTKGYVVEWDEEHKPLRMVGIHIDITKQKETEEELRKSRDEWELTFDSIPDLISILDTKHNTVRYNKAMRDALNISHDGCVGEKCYSLMHGTACPIDECPHAALLKDNQHHSITRFENKLNGHYNITTSPILNKDGSLRGSVHISRNVSEQTEAQNKIKQFAAMIEHSPAFIGIADMSGKMLYLNNSNKRIFELDPDEDLETLQVADLITDTSIELYRSTIIPETIKHGIWSGELEWKSRSGKIIPVIIVVMIHKDSHGNPEFTSATAINISEIKKKEAELEKLTTDLQSLSSHLQIVREEERKSIAKEIHDELGQNLTGLKLSVSWICNHLDDDRNVLLNRLEQLKTVTDETVQTSRRLYNSLYPQLLEEVGLLGAIMWHANTYLKQNNIQFTLQSNLKEEKMPESLMHICLSLYRIYQESVTNILRYAQATSVSIVLNRHEDEVILSITDNGIGFDIKNVDTRLHHGLIGIRERVRYLKGSLDINSTSGNGTCTTVKIPVGNIKCH